MNKYKQHQIALKKIKLETQNAIPEVRLFDRHVGLFFRDNLTPVKINKPGMADIWGILKTFRGLLHIEIEVKTGDAVLKKDQKIWKEFILSMGGIYIEARNSEDAINRIKKEL